MAAKTARKAEIVSVLRSRGLQARADWFDRELPEIVDLPHNRGLLTTLGIDPAVLAEAAPATVSSARCPRPARRSSSGPPGGRSADGR